MHDPSFTQEFPALADALAGQLVVRRELGRGGMGVVFLALDVPLERLVALKVLPPALASQPVTRERFVREARTAARLAHPNVVPVYRADAAADTAFFTMAYVEGESLADRLRDRGPLPVADAVPILRDVAYALAYAHARGVVHRDVKPENILLERATRRTLVTDFGIARHVDEPAARLDPAARLTSSGQVLGTLHYMSPEQVNGTALDGRSDLYALGVVAFQLLSGQLPFEGLPPTAVLVAHATRTPPPLRTVAPHVPAALAAAVDRCLAKRPEARYATGEALADALGAALEQARVADPDLRDARDLPLPPGLPARIDDAQAAAIWRRAAELQAAALRRRELEDVARARLEGAAWAQDRGGGLDRGVVPSGDASAPDDRARGYRLGDVAAAAEDAGISRQYVALALSELPRGAALGAGAPADEVSDRAAALLLGATARALTVSHLVPAAPARALRALGAVLQAPPYRLRLGETIGGHPLDGGVLVFAFTGAVAGAVGGAAESFDTHWVHARHGLSAAQLHVTLRAVPGASDLTEVTVTCDVRPGVRRNVRVTRWLAGVFGGGTGALTGAVLAKGAAVALGAGVLGPAAAAGLLAAGTSLWMYRLGYPRTLERARGEILDALVAVAAAVQSEDVFGTLPGAGAPRAIAADRDPDLAVVPGR